MKLRASFYHNIIEKKECPSLPSFLYCLLKTMKLLNKSVFYFHCLKSIPNGDLFKEHINLVAFIKLKYML